MFVWPQHRLHDTLFNSMLAMAYRDIPFAAAATSSVHQYSRKVGEQLSEHLSSAWRKTSSNSGIRHLGEKLQSFKL